VVGEINAGCGACEWCWAAMERHCPHRTVLGILGRPGCFAEMIALPQRNLRPVSSSISNEAAVFVEPVAAAFQILDQVPIEKHMSVLVAGDGRLGLLCAHVLALHGAKVTLAGRHPERQDLLPADVRHVTGLLEGDPPEAKDLFPLAVEATGKPEVLEALLPFMRPRATLILKTTSEAPASLNLALAVIHEITVLGSRCGRFEPAIRALEREAIPVERWIHGRYPLEKGVEAIRRAGEPGVLKILLDVEAE
jgi:alcohol dehydrogenase